MRNSILTIAFCLVLGVSFSQQRRVGESSAGYVKHQLIKGYGAHTCFVDSLHGKRHGPIKFVSADSITYILGEYNYGIQCGEWFLNYPDGAPRRFSVFNEKGKPISWNRYYKHKKIISIEDSEGLSKDLHEFLMSFDDEQFALETKQYQSDFKIVRENGRKGIQQYERIYDIEGAYNDLKDVLSSQQRSVTISYWNHNDTKRSEYVLSKGFPTEKRIYFYGGKRLKKTITYHNRISKTTNYYNKDGELKKSKTEPI